MQLRSRTEDWRLRNSIALKPREQRSLAASQIINRLWPEIAKRRRLRLFVGLWRRN
jgi:hypothetical protein